MNKSIEQREKALLRTCPQCGAVPGKFCEKPKSHPLGQEFIDKMENVLHFDRLLGTD